jgi:hypothetical protein
MLEPFLQRYWQAVQAPNSKLNPERDAFRWHLEEFRVSLFARKRSAPLWRAGILPATWDAAMLATAKARRLRSQGTERLRSRKD